MNGEVSASRGTYAGLFMVSLATLTYEILLTRIFSVTTYYHLAFVAVSIAMFGMTVGAVSVYLCPGYFRDERAPYHMSLSALLFAVTTVGSFLIYLRIPFATDIIVATFFSTVFTYAIVSIPFVFSGICVCVALTKFRRQVSTLYATDLAGAALGCILVIGTLTITDGPTAVIVVALLAALGSLFAATGVDRRRLRGVAASLAVLLAAVALGHTVLVHRQTPLLRLEWVKEGREPRPLYEKWNSFSRIQVRGNPTPQRPTAMSFSPLFFSKRKIGQLQLTIDGDASTVLTEFRDNVNDLEYLKYDMVNFAHHIRHDARVLVVGVGGGRDILSALAFGQKSVTGVEINNQILKAVNGRFGDFTGHLDRDPRVTFVNDEARSYTARTSEHFDIVQISFIDTWAATAAGAFVLSENAIYTVEAWRTFLEHLTPSGVLAVSRWYLRQSPAEVYRVTALAAKALMETGVANPREHMVILRLLRQTRSRYAPVGVGTILVCREPFSNKDLDVMEAVATEMQFEIVLSPNTAIDDIFAEIAKGKRPDQLAAKMPLNVSAPTDDCPFFFHMLRFRDVFNRDLWREGQSSFNMKAVFFLSALLVTVVVLTLLCVIIPLLTTARKTTLKGATPLFLFFAAIGLGFMLIEISQLQRLIIFLGHPTYGLSVVLFSLLLSSGAGSYLTENVRSEKAGHSGTVRLFILLGVLVLFGMLTPYAAREFSGSITPLRILVAVLLLSPLGLCMGMAFPLGMKVASRRSTSLTPWLWGINGATSVCASVLAVAIAMSSGISTSFWTGFGCYAVASIAFVWASRERG